MVVFCFHHLSLCSARQAVRTSPTAMTQRTTCAIKHERYVGAIVCGAARPQQGSIAHTVSDSIWAYTRTCWCAYVPVTVWCVFGSPPSILVSNFSFLWVTEREREKFMIRQPPIGEGRPSERVLGIFFGLGWILGNPFFFFGSGSTQLACQVQTERAQVKAP